MKKHSSVTFKAIQSSWGIYITIEASTSSLPGDVSIEEPILDGYFLRLNQSRRLLALELEHLKTGLKSILVNRPTEPVLITIEEISFVEVDFQANALFWAARMLAADLLGIATHAPRIEFDVQSNTYLFHPNDESSTVS